VGGVFAETEKITRRACVFSPASSLLLFTGFSVLLCGLLAGAPLGSAVNRGAQEESIRAWRVAHSSLVNGGVLLLAVSAVLPQLAFSQGWQLVASVLLSISIYAFSFALLFGAWKGHRGLQKSATAAGNLVYLVNMTGVILSLAATALLAYGASVSLVKSLSS
jgi:hypothetical protein